jgi:hypothetical protein
MRNFVTAYKDCLLWSSIDNADEQGGEPLDANYDFDDFAPEALAQIESDCAAFLSDPRTLALCEKHGMAQSGHDFWLTRNHHGAGFWDRGYPKDEGDYLTERAHVYSEQDAYVGDDGSIYLN